MNQYFELRWNIKAVKILFFHHQVPLNEESMSTLYFNLLKNQFQIGA